MDLGPTRRALHGVAELLLAGPQYRASGTIRLVVAPGGFGTLKAPQVRVEGAELVVGGHRYPIAGQSCAKLGAAAGLDVGAPHGLYHDGSGVSPDEPLALDPDAARYLARCWAIGDEALRALAPEEQPILWPEHFDIGIRTQDTNYGLSPGDDYLPEPYAYVTPPTAGTGEFWNAPFGAARPIAELPGADAVVAFYREGRDRVASGRVAAILHDAAETHHVVYGITDGADEDWASWYADWLVRLSALPEVLGTRPVRSELTWLLVDLDKRYTADRPDRPWEVVYAERVLRHFAPGKG